MKNTATSTEIYAKIKQLETKSAELKAHALGLKASAEIERQNPACGEFVRVLRELARGFQFDAMKEILRKARDAA